MFWSRLMAALKSGAWTSWAGTLISAAVTLGVMNASEATLIASVVASLNTLILAVIAVTHTIHIAQLQAPDKPDQANVE